MLDLFNLTKDPRNMKYVSWNIFILYSDLTMLWELCDTFPQVKHCKEASWIVFCLKVSLFKQDQFCGVISTLVGEKMSLLYSWNETMHFVSHFFIDGWTYPQACTLIARFIGLTWGPSGADRTQVGPMLAPWTLLSGKALFFVVSQHSEYMLLCLEFIMLFMMVDFMQQFRNWFSLLRVYFNIYLISVLSDKCARHWPCFTFAGASNCPCKHSENALALYEPSFLHARPWIPGDEKSIFTVVIH